MFAQILASQGEKVVALDSDPMPGMSYALGINVDDAPIPSNIVVAGPQSGPEWVLNPNIDPISVIEKYSVKTPEGVHYFQFGNSHGASGDLSRAQHAWSEVVRNLPTSSWSIVGDLPGGLRQPMNGWGKYADIALIVTEPTTKGVITAKQLSKLTTATWGPRAVALVVNKLRESDDPMEIARRANLPLAGAVPENELIKIAERELRSVFRLPGAEAIENAILGIIQKTRVL